MDATIGRRLRTIRLERGYTQTGLARRAGLSTELVSKLERDDRRSTSWASMTKLARALDIDPSMLAGKKPRLNPVPGAAVLTVRDAIIRPTLLPGMVRDHDREPAPEAEVWNLVERAYGAYFGGEFGVLASDLPQLLDEAYLSNHRAALGHAYQLAACLMVHSGRDDAAAIAAERAIHAGREGDDPWRLATFYGAYSWVLLHQGRLDEAEQVATWAADGIEPSLSKAPAKQLTVWGGLILQAAVACGARKDAERAKEYLSIAKAGAARVGKDRHDYWVSFGPTHAAIQETHIMTALDQPGSALTAARQVDPHVLFAVQHGRHLLNVAKCLMESRRTDEAIQTAGRAKDFSPEWFRHQGFARSLVDDLVERKQRMPAPLRDLIQTMHAPSAGTTPAV